MNQKFILLKLVDTDRKRLSAAVRQTSHLLWWHRSYSCSISPLKWCAHSSILCLSCLLSILLHAPTTIRSLWIIIPEYKSEEVKHRKGHSFNTQVLGGKAHLTHKGYKKDMYKNMNIRARDLPRRKQTGVYESQKREVTPRLLPRGSVAQMGAGPPWIRI